MKKPVAFVLLLVVTAWAQDPSFEQDYSFRRFVAKPFNSSVESLRFWLNAKDLDPTPSNIPENTIVSGRRHQAEGYILGVLDMSEISGLVCIPKGINYGVTEQVVRNYLDSHPEKWHLDDPASSVALALQEKFPCPSKPTASEESRPVKRK